MEEFYKKFIYKYEPLYKPIEELEDLLYEYYGVNRVDVQRKSFDDIASSIGEGLARNYIDNVDDITTVKELKGEKLYRLFDSKQFKTQINSLLCSIIDIYIYYPTVKITNELNTEHTITDLYVKLKVNYQGILYSTFKILRSTFSELEYRLGYIHSHVTTFDSISSPDFFNGNPCIGNGPIRDTIGSLNTTFNKDLWKLFCLELDKFLETESISGGPYLSIDYIAQGNTIPLYKPSSNMYAYVTSQDIFDIKLFVNKFIDYCIESNALKIVYKVNRYTLGISLLEYNLLITKELFKYLREVPETANKTIEYLLDRNILMEVYIDDLNIYKYIKDATKKTYPTDFKVLTFKNESIKLKISDTLPYNLTKTILNPKISSYILFNLLKFINVNYGKSSIKSKIL